MSEASDIQTQMGRLNTALAEYANYTWRNSVEIVEKQGSKLGFEISQEFLKLKPGKGVIMAQGLAALAGGYGIRVRQSVRDRLVRKFRVTQKIARFKNGRAKKTIYGKQVMNRLVGRGINRSKTVEFSSKKVKGSRLNLQALAVQSELRLREKGRGFTAFGAKIKSFKVYEASRANFRYENTHFSKLYGNALALFGVKANDDSASFNILYAPPGSHQSELGNSMNTPAGQRAIARGISATVDDIMIHVVREQDKAAQKALAAHFPTTQS